MAKQFNDGDVCQLEVTGKHSFYKNDKGTHVLEFPCQVLGKAKDNENTAEGYDLFDKPVNRTIYVYISAKSKSMAIKNLKIMGFPKDKVAVGDINPASETVFDFVGKKFQATVKEDEKYGLKFEIGGPVKMKPTEESLAQLESLFEDDGGDDPFSDK